MLNLLLVLVVLKGVEVEEVEDTHQPGSQLRAEPYYQLFTSGASAHLQHGGESTVLGKLILVVPPPVGPAVKDVLAI